jgi:NADPH-dependent 2,4-dienoyl-CoA reductase/sulfur reductase-like enzyme/rhodanese-related sulfurtransferase
VRIGASPGPVRKRRRVVIIGGVTAGPKTAARLRRLDADADITMIERSEFLSYTGCSLPAYVSGRVESPRALMSTADNALRTARFFQTVKDVRVLNRTVATGIDRGACLVHCSDVEGGRVFTVPYDVLVLATGARPFVPAVPGIGLDGIYTLYSLDAARELRSHLQARGSQDVYVIGAGLIGVTAAESLVEAGARVTLVERDPVILGQYFDTDMARRVQEEFARRGVKVITSAAVTRIEQDRDQLRIETGNRSHLADLIVLATGVIPNADLAERAGLEIGSSGGVRVNGHLQTSDPRIWAVGDCAETISLTSGRWEFLPLGSVSTKMGRIAADCIAGRDTQFHGSVGTAMFRIFDVNAARCGLTNARALERGFDAVSVVVTGLDRPHGERGAQRVHIKVTADRRTGALLGAQGLGAGNVVPRVQILAAALSRGLTLGEVFDLDLGYNPAFTTAIDISQTACLLLQSKMEGSVRTITREELLQARQPPRIVDVAPYAEYSLRPTPGSVNVPLEHLRSEGIPFTVEEKVVLCDAMSLGAYEAYHILAARGWKNLAILEGGTDGLSTSPGDSGPLP